jgi:hypothetical protein
MKTAIYRQLNNKNIQLNLSKKLKDCQLVGQREITIGNRIFVLNNFLEKADMFFGEIIEISIDETRILELNKKQTKYDIKANIKDIKEQIRIQKSALYFGILEEHIIVCQSSVIRIRGLEDFLRKFLDNPDLNINEYHKENLEDIRQKDLKSIKVNIPLFDDVAKDNLYPRLFGLNNKKKGSFDRLNSFFGTNIEEAENNIELEISIRYKNKPLQNSQKIMNALRDYVYLIEDDFTTRYTDNTILSSDSIRLQRQIDFDEKDSFDNICGKIWNCFYYWVNEGDIFNEKD